MSTDQKTVGDFIVRKVTFTTRKLTTYYKWVVATKHEVFRHCNTYAEAESAALELTRLAALKAL